VAPETLTKEENIEFFQNELAIFDRWGIIVYEKKDYRNQWKGEEQPDGTYFYVLVLEDGREFTGHLTLLK
jgi:gliding motility-associated-like protein